MQAPLQSGAESRRQLQYLTGAHQLQHTPQTVVDRATSWAPGYVPPNPLAQFRTHIITNIVGEFSLHLRTVYLYRSDEIVGARELVQLALGTLSGAQFRVIELAHFEGQSLREIAEHLGERYEIVRHHYYRGLEKMKTALEEIFLAQAQPD